MQSNFPHLQDRICFENAGGTQIPIQVLENTQDFLKNTYVQPYGYTVQSMLNTNLVAKSKNFVSTLINNINGNIILGPSATQIASNLCNSLTFNENDEIILSNFSHESAIGCFERIPNTVFTRQSNWVKIKMWNVDEKCKANVDELLGLITNKTELIVLPHVSNVLGNVLDIKEIVRKIRLINKNVKIYVDGVSYLPHNIIDVHDMDVDFYVVSFYKFLGTRISALYVKKGVLRTLKNINHHFLDSEQKLEVGGIQYEHCASLLGIQEYLCDFARKPEFNREIVIENFKEFRAMELEFIEYFDDKFNTIKDNLQLEILTDYNCERVPIFSIYGPNIDKLCFFLNKMGIECKTGNFYCKRLLDSFNIDKVLRISLVHYNSICELDTFFSLLRTCKKNSHNLVEYIQYKYDLSETVKDSFNYLHVDSYYENKRYRAFSLINVEDFSIIGESYFLQSKLYNSFLGDELRIYNNISEELLNDESFRAIISKFINTISNAKQYKYLYVHQIRIECDYLDTNPVPEGIHQDGYEYICITCVNKENIFGPHSEIYDKEHNLIHKTIMEPGENIILNDNKYFHNVTPLKRIEQNKMGYRDIFVFTTVM